MEPVTAGILSQFLPGLLGNIFGSPAATPTGPTTAQIAAMLRAQQTASDSARNAWLIGLGLAAAGAVALVVVLSRK
jgi:hypothetical protein